MKKAKLIGLFLILNVVLYAQTDSIYIIKSVNEMTDKVYYFANKDFVVANETRKKGFKVSTILKDEMEFDVIYITMVGIGSCNEKDELIILFENGQKMKSTSWKSFNCEGTTYFSPTDEDLILLRTQPLSKMRIMNGRSFDSYTGEVEKKDKRYFIQLFNALDNKLFIEKK